MNYNTLSHIFLQTDLLVKFTNFSNFFLISSSIINLSHLKKESHLIFVQLSGNFTCNKFLQLLNPLDSIFLIFLDNITTFKFIKFSKVFE